MSLFDLLSANRGGAGGIGHKAATAALNKGYSRSEIAAAMGSAEVKAAQRAAGVAETNQNLMADLGATDIGNRFGGEHFGHADVAAARDQGHSEMAIANYIANTEGAYNKEAGGTAGSGYRQLMTNVALGAGLEQAAAQQQQQAQQMSQMSGQIGDWSNRYNQMSGAYDTLKGQYDALGKKYDTAMQTAQQAKEESMKIKYTGSTAVQNPSAMGIKAAQGKVIRGSGMAGAGALARPTKGQKIRTLNV